MDYPRVCIEVVVMNYGSVLLYRETLQDPQVKWAFPRTTQQMGETIQQAAQRAVSEQCGVSVEAVNALNAYDQIDEDGDEHLVVLNIEARYLDGEFSCDNETTMAAWASGIALRSMEVDENTLLILRKLGFIDWM